MQNIARRRTEGWLYLSKIKNKTKSTQKNPQNTFKVKVYKAYAFIKAKREIRAATQLPDLVHICLKRLWMVTPV